MPAYMNPGIAPTTGGGYPSPGGYTTPGVAGDIGAGLGMASSLYGLISGINLNKQAGTVLGQSNPFGAYRPYYGDQLLKLMQDPSSVTKLPGYDFLMGQGTAAIDRTAAGPGGVGYGSTAEKGLLTQYGQGLADQFYQQQVQTLSQLAGSGISPANPYQALQGVAGAQNIMGGSANNLINTGLNLYNKLYPNTAVMSGTDMAGMASDISTGIGTGASDTAFASALAGDPAYASALDMMGGAASGGGGAAMDLTSLFSGFSAAGGGAATAAPAAAGAAAADVTGAGAATAGAASTGVDLGLAGAAGAVGLALAPVIMGIMSPAYTTTSAYTDRVNKANQAAFAGGPGGPGSPWHQGLVQLSSQAEFGNVSQQQWDALKQYGITPQNYMQLLMQSNVYTPGTTPTGGGGGRL